MTKKIAFEARPKRRKQLQKVPLLKSVFLPLGPLGGPKKLYHVKFKSKISYLGEKISILPWQMAEQLAVEVDVKNVMEQQDKPIYFVWIYINPALINT